jgi:hypothetical protein
VGLDLPDGHGDPPVNRDFEDLGGADPYELLGVPPDVCPAEVQRAYRRLARAVHPDRGGDAEILKRLNLARDVLLDPARRIEFDQRRRQQQSGNSEAHKIHEEAPPPRTASHESQFGWTFGTGPGPQPEPEPRPPPPEDQFAWAYGAGPTPHPEPEPQTWSAEEQFGWTYGTGPTPQRHRPSQPDPTYRPTAYQSAYPYRRGRSRLAYAVLAVSLLCWPVAIPAGIALLVRVRRRNERGAVIAWIAIAWGFIGLYAAIYHGWP